jgi:biotin carboxylase
MRVLVTNSFHLVAYPVICALRRRAQFIAVAHMGERASDAALSRYVDARVQLALPRLVPKGTILEAGVNSPLEQAYLDKLCGICRRLRLDTVFPTSDFELLVLAKNADMLAADGVRALVPGIEALRQVQDKLVAVRLAEAHGLPVPRTIAADRLDVAAAVAELGLPVMVKARFSYGGFGVRLASSVDEAQRYHRELAAWSGDPFLQEAVPGNREPSVNVIMTRDGVTPIRYTLRKMRHVHTSFSTAVKVVAEIPEGQAVTSVLAASGLVGFAAVQLKEDSRDGVHRLIEINPRFGANFRIVTTMAQLTGVDLVGAAVDAHLGRPVAPAMLDVGQVGVSAVEDFYALRSYLRARKTGDMPPLPQWLGTLLAQHVRPGVIKDIFWQRLFRDWRAVLSSYHRTLTQDLHGDPRLISYGDWRA